MKNEIIEALVSAGCNRWTKGNYDRLYINAETLGLECDYYKTGNIFSAKFNGEEISNSKAKELKAARTYIDVTTGKIFGNNETLRKAARKLVNSMN